MAENTIRLKTRTCIYCGKSGHIDVSYAGFKRYEKGAMAQDAFPDLSADEREQIISGTHPECWNKIFGDEE